MDDLINTIVAQMLKSQSMEGGFRTINDILLAWVSQSDFDALRRYLIQTSNYERYPGARYLPSEVEIRNMDANRVRDKLLEQFAYDVMREGAQQAESLDREEALRPTGDLSDLQGASIASIGKALARSSPGEAVTALIHATILWAQKVDGEIIVKNAMASGHYRADWKSEDAYIYVYYCLITYMTGL